MQIKSAVLFALLGGIIIGAALFAEAIGLDNDPGWGKGRIAILVLGILVIVCGICYSFYTDTVLSISRKIQSLISQNITRLFVFLRGYWYTFPVLTFVILVYVWFASSGSWTHWEPATHRYADLAISFREGKLYLPIQPNSQLRSLSNPYDPESRKGINYPVDYSLYKGKFYFYWGPIPALILVILSPFTRGRVGDLYLAFSFVCGIFLLQFLLTIKIWDRFFHDLPKWILVISLFVLGLITPWTYMLINEPNGRIYEAAISGGQFFLLSGFLVVMMTLGKPAPPPWALAVTGCLWALAIGTRLALVLPIGSMVITVAYRIWETSRSSPPVRVAVRWLSLGLPLLLGFMGLGWYNWARFDSVTETGLAYQLAGANQQADAFSPIHMVQNLYNYLFHPPSAMWQFPFLYPKEDGPVVGLLFLAPFTMFAILPIAALLRKAIQKSLPTSKDNSNDFLNWIIISLTGALFSAFGLLLIFFATAIHYWTDLMPALAMLSVLGFWQGYQLLAHRPLQQKIYSTLGIIFAGASFLVNILISIAVKQIGRTGL